MTPTDEMTDGEAEAVLLALGPPSLEWKNFNDLITSNYVINIVDGYEEQYEVSSNHRETRFYTRCTRGRFEHSRNPAMLATEEDAKTACQWHHATGKWQ